MREWLLAVTAAALAAALAQALVPKGAVRTVVAMAAGMVLLLTALEPLTKAEAAPGGLGELLENWEVPETGEETRQVLKTLIAEKTGAYILDKGRSLGVQCRAKVTVADDASGWPVPWQVEVWGTWTQAQKQALSRAVEEELNIPGERQSFWEEGA